MPPKQKSLAVKSSSSKPSIPGTSNKRARSPEADAAVSSSQHLKRVKNAPAIAAEATTTEVPSFTGNFDLYPQSLKPLSGVYLPRGASVPRYEALFHKILAEQEKPNRKMQIYLAADSRDISELYGQPCDPFTQMPVDDVALTSIEHHELLVLPKIQGSKTSFAARPGISASLRWDKSQCGVKGIAGTLKLSRLWIKAASDGTFVELFEGHISYKISYGPLYQRKGHGSGDRDTVAFWAVRARVDSDGYEVGLRDGIPPTIPRWTGANLVAGSDEDAVESWVKMRSEIQADASAPPKFSGTLKFYDLETLASRGLTSYDNVYELLTDPELNHYPDLTCAFDKVTYEDDWCRPSSRTGLVYGPAVGDPNNSEPYNFLMPEIQQYDKLVFKEHELVVLGQRTEASKLPRPGVVMSLELAYWKQHPDVESAEGYLKIIRAWSSIDANGNLLELFEGFLRVNTKSYEPECFLDWEDSMEPYREGPVHIGFWAVRAEKDAEEEDEEEEDEYSDEETCLADLLLDDETGDLADLLLDLYY